VELKEAEGWAENRGGIGRWKDMTGLLSRDQRASKEGRYVRACCAWPKRRAAGDGANS